ncbi:MAG: hypothetical protein ACK5RO_01425 [Pseudobdellovibrionaceae bacterium]|jgi:hypothetical protein|nr:hypothetical protein [Chitinophagaceae bacterium]MCA6567130.1 hypothetical protein [Pseudanabaena sp. M151S2SP2A07QC]
MSFSNAAETAVLDQVFRGVALPWNGNTNLWIALCTANPGEAGTAAAMSETTYGGYARQAVNRSTGLSVAGATVSNAALVQFPQCSSGTSTITHCAIVDSASGAGNIVAYAALNTSIPVSTGIQPQFAASALQWTLD